MPENSIKITAEEFEAILYEIYKRGIFDAHQTINGKPLIDDEEKMKVVFQRHLYNLQLKTE